jgi:hypothetical protein
MRKSTGLLFLAVILGAVVSVSAATQSSVTQYGITWTFNQAREVGQFANGDYWVLGPVTITSITPDFAARHNGWEVNPRSTSKQGFDHRAASYSDSLVPALPYTSSGPASIVKSISVDTSQATCRPCLRAAAVLTVVEAIPPDSGRTVFRPPYFGMAKPYYSINDLQTHLLPSLAPVTSTPALGTRLTRVFLDHQSGWSGAAIHPTENMPEYGSSVAIATGEVALRLTLNDALSLKMPSLIGYVQVGIDLYHDLLGGSTWPANGGHALGRKLPMAFAGLLLGNTAMQDAVSTAPFNTFQEDGHLPFVQRANHGAGQVLFGDPGSDVGYWQCVVTPDALGNRTLKDPYGFIDGGHRPGGGYQYCCNSLTWKGHALMLHLMPQLKAIWGNDHLEVYEDRWVNLGAWAQPDSCAPPDFSDTTATGDFNSDTTKGSHYRKTYGPDPQHPGDCIRDTNPSDGMGRFPSLHGSNRNDGGYGSTFANNMWTAYRALDPIHEGGMRALWTDGTVALQLSGNPVTQNCPLTIRYQQPKMQPAALSIRTGDGIAVKEYPAMPAGQGWREVVWDASDNAGHKVPAGLYYVQYGSGAGQAIQKIIVLH